MDQILIIGGCGFIGQHLTKALKAEGHSVAVFDNMSQAAGGNANADHAFIGDARDLSQAEPYQWDYIFHCAGPAGPARIKRGYALSAIQELTRAGLDVAQKGNARFLKFSSSEVYGRSDVKLTEDTPGQ